jgi:hypothetical protein
MLRDLSIMPPNLVASALGLLSSNGSLPSLQCEYSVSECECESCMTVVASSWMSDIKVSLSFFDVWANQMRKVSSFVSFLTLKVQMFTDSLPP